jgi:hypothetical protein
MNEKTAIKAAVVREVASFFESIRTRYRLAPGTQPIRPHVAQTAHRTRHSGAAVASAVSSVTISTGI